MGTVNAKLHFDKPLNGIIIHPGISTFLTDTKNAGSVNNLWTEPNTGAIILQPDISLKSMGGSDPNWTDGSGNPVAASGGAWELVTMPGQPDLKLLHQKDSTADHWSLTGSDTFYRNQGFVLYWSKFATPSGKDPKITMRIGTISDYYITITIYPGQKVTVLDSLLTLYEKNLPASYMPSDIPINSIICFFVNNTVLVGFNGVANLMAFDIAKNVLLTDVNGLKYSLVAGSPSVTTSSLEIIASGAGVFGFKGLTYISTNGNSTTKDNYSHAVPSTDPTASVTSSIQPTGTSIAAALDSHSTEGDGRYKYKAKVTLNGSTAITPILYSWQVSHGMERASAASDIYDLEVDIKGYQDTMSEGKNGQYQGGAMNVDITCYQTYYTDIAWRRAHMIGVQISPGLDLAGNLLPYYSRGKYQIDKVVPHRKEFNEFDLKISARDIVKRCENQIIIESEIYDLLPDAQRRHYDIMQKLADKAGVAINIPSTPLTDPIMPKSAIANQPNWQFQRGATIWECMEVIRQFSGWILYPDQTGQLVYKPRPTYADALVSGALYTLSSKTDYKEIEGEIVDLVRTRFLVWGMASVDETVPAGYGSSGGIYVPGQIIGAFIPDLKNLELEIGETRYGMAIEPMLGSIDAVKAHCRGIADWYTRPHKRIKLGIPDMRDFMNLWMYSIIAIDDDKLASADPRINFNGYYIVNGLSLTGNPNLVTGTLDAMMLEP